MTKSEWFWDMISDRFDEETRKFESIQIKTVEKTKKYLNDSDIILDYGCGTGTAAIEIASHVTKIYGIDVSSKMIEAAKRKATDRKIKNADFAQATIFDGRYKRNSFDAILAFNILHLIKDKWKIMQRINELLKPGGRIVSVTPCSEDVRTFSKSLLSLVIRTGALILPLPYLRFYKFSELEDLIAGGKFQVVETENLSHSETFYFIAAKKT